ncbi:hypothetical protein L6452_22220 [Arctium lappa]|uniref:Uncharacterized protein n=1 Tax=Arctium lappa TaxID=4217 RepID=A0ACB9AYL1_ARCLA|nr:hypothetical protein L6452_22220 [Arctium lappa]
MDIQSPQGDPLLVHQTMRCRMSYGLVPVLAYLPEALYVFVKHICDIFYSPDDHLEDFDRLSDDDVVRLCLLLLLEVGFLGHQPAAIIGETYIRLMEDLDA